MDSKDWDGEDRRTRGVPLGSMERHAQTIVAGLILAGVLWVGGMLVDLRDRTSRAEEKALAQTTLITSLATQVQIGLSDRYTTTEARREFAEMYRRISQLEDHMARAERERSVPRRR